MQVKLNKGFGFSACTEQQEVKDDGTNVERKRGRRE